MPISKHHSKKQSANEWKRKRNIRVFNCKSMKRQTFAKTINGRDYLGEKIK